MARGPVTGEAGRLRVARLAPFPQAGVSLTCRGGIGDLRISELFPGRYTSSLPNLASTHRNGRC